MKRKKQKMRATNKNGSKGFTLLEMLIVISILAIFYSIAAVHITGLQNEARVSRANGDLKTLKLAIESYSKNKDELPAEENYQTILILARPRVIPGHLMDPFGRTYNTLYVYKTSQNGEFYVAYSLGMNKSGSASVDDSGHVSSTGSAIIATNGYI